MGDPYKKHPYNRPVLAWILFLKKICAKKDFGKFAEFYKNK